jgi:YVTN family beta-propeller protein
VIDGTVSRIDPRSRRVVATVPVGGNPSEIDAGPDGVWVTSHAL